MADDLDRLEKEVEAARDRLSGDLAILRSPSTYSDFTGRIRQTALNTKNSVVDEVRNRTNSAVEDALETLKAKAAANPTATLVIGAGLAWQLLRRPPIVTALVGGGLISLLRTPASGIPKTAEEHLADAKKNLGVQAGEIARVAGRATQQSADAVKAKAVEVTDQMRDAAETVAGQTRAFATAKLGDVPDHVRHSTERSPVVDKSYSPPNVEGSMPIPDQQDTGRDQLRRFMSTSKDSVLVGAAGLAIAAVFALTLQRRADSSGRKGGASKP
jgi:hypothetical protein